MVVGSFNPYNAEIDCKTCNQTTFFFYSDEKGDMNLTQWEENEELNYK